MHQRAAARFRLNRPQDGVEQEAERAAEHVAGGGSLTGWSFSRVPVHAGEDAVHRDTAASPCPCEAEEEVTSAVASSSAPISAELRDDMERRFGADFSRVRLHSGGAAAASAHELGARAYTVGDHIVVGSDAPALATTEGRRLLAHELAHVVQLRSSRNLVLRDDKPAGKPADKRADAPPAATRRDVVILLDESLVSEAKTLAPDAVIVRAKTLDQLASNLKKVTEAMRTIYVVSHALPSGDLQFTEGDTAKFERPENVATKLKGVIPADRTPESIDFRGCTVGAAPAAMEKLRDAVGAKSAIAGTCYLVTQDNGPVVLGNGTAVTKRSQVTKANRAEFEQGLKMLGDAFGKAKKCILKPTEDSYFAAGGKWVAQWFNPTLSTEWDVRKSKCYSDLTAEVVDPTKTPKIGFDITGHCRLIKVEKSP